MKILKLILIWALVFMVFAGADVALASSFGITPPYVRNSQLAKSTVYEQRILLVRGSPNESLKAEITIDVPGADDWITIEQGNEFIMPRGENRVPMVVRVEVPQDADFGEYSGTIRIRMSPDDDSMSPGVSIALGAQIDVALNVVDIEIYELKIHSFKLEDAEEGRNWGWLYFPGKIQAIMRVQNSGNVRHAPSSVKLEIHSTRDDTLLETTESIGKIQKLDPFAVETITADIPTDLPPGSYRAKYFVMDGDEVLSEGALRISILPEGSLLGYTGFGFAGLSLVHKMSLFGIAFGILALGFLIFFLRRRRVLNASIKNND